MKRNARQSVYAGFTLVELLVVVSIIALLITLLLPTFGRAKDITRRIADQATINGLDRACESYASDNNGLYPASAAEADVKHHVTRHCMYTPGTSGTPADFTYGNGVAYPGACLLFDRLARFIDDSTGNPLLTGKNNTAGYEVGSFKTAQMRHPTAAGQLVDAYCFVDSFGNPILYYSLCTDMNVDPTVNFPRYWDEHNPSAGVYKGNNLVPPLDTLSMGLGKGYHVDLPKQASTPAPGLPQPARPAPAQGVPYSMRWNSDTGLYEYYRGYTNANQGHNFILISPGKDGKYVPASGDPNAQTAGPSIFKFNPATDDVTNLSR